MQNLLPLAYLKIMASSEMTFSAQRMPKIIFLTLGALAHLTSVIRIYL